MFVVHSKYKSGPAWHKRYAHAFIDGLKQFGKVEVTEDDGTFAWRIEAIHIIFGPNYFPTVFERAKVSGTALTVNRCFYGDKDDNVAIGWNGFNGLAKFPKLVPGRLAEQIDALPKKEYKEPIHDHIALILGEFVSPCDDRKDIQAFYAACVKDAKAHGMLPIFRPHPLAKHDIEGAATTPNGQITAAKRVYTYASTYGVHARLIGAPVYAEPASLAASPAVETNTEWLQRVVAAQWHIDEIKSGKFWEYLKDA